MYTALTGNQLLIIDKSNGNNITINCSIDDKQLLEQAQQLIQENKKDELLEMFMPKNLKLKEKFNKEFFEERDGSLYMKGIDVSIPELLAEKLAIENKESYMNFWRLCAGNPDPAARDNTFWFLATHDFKILDNGCFVVFRNVDVTTEKGVYTDRWTGKMRIRFGEVVSIDRMLCDSDQGRTCSSGLHVASKSWLYGNMVHGNTGIVCIVNPMHVVAVPPQDSYGKMRVCEYLPVGLVSEESTLDMDKAAEVLDNIILTQIDNLKIATATDGKKKVLFPETEGIESILQTAKESIEKRIINK